MVLSWHFRWLYNTLLANRYLRTGETEYVQDQGHLHFLQTTDPHWSTLILIIEFRIQETAAVAAASVGQEIQKNNHESTKEKKYEKL